MKDTEEFEAILDNLISKKLELISKRKELHSLHEKFQTIKNNGIGAKDFRKVESEIEILIDEVEVLYLQKSKIENKMEFHYIDKSMIENFTLTEDQFDLDEE